MSKKKKIKNPKPESEARIQRLRDGIRERSSTWSKFKDKPRQQVKLDIKKETTND